MNHHHVRRKEGEKGVDDPTGISGEGENLGTEQVSSRGCLRDGLLCEAGTADNKGCRCFFEPKEGIDSFTLHPEKKGDKEGAC